jgi:hypothetical protein
VTASPTRPARKVARDDEDRLEQTPNGFDHAGQICAIGDRRSVSANQLKTPEHRQIRITADHSPSVAAAGARGEPLFEMGNGFVDLLERISGPHTYRGRYSHA